MDNIRDYTINLLTIEDINSLKNNPSPIIRAQIATKISSQYVKNTFTANQTQIADDICRILMVDSDAIVREALSDKLKDSTVLPKDIALTLANDKSDSVALPMLQSSSVLLDSDLINIIKTTENATRQVAISKREKVSETVSHALVETDNKTVIHSLLDNKGAKVSEESFESVMTAYAADPVISKQLAERSSSNFLSTEEKSVELAINNLLKQNKLTPSVIIEVLCMGNTSFFEMSLAKLLGINIATIQDILTQKGKNGFDILYKKASMPEPMKESLFLVYSIIKNMEISGEKQANKTLKNYLTIIHGHIKDSIKSTKIEFSTYILAIIEKKILSENVNPNTDW